MSEVQCELVNAMADSERYGTISVPALPARGTILTVPDPKVGTPIHLRVVGVSEFVAAANGSPAKVVLKVLWN